MGPVKAGKKRSGEGSWSVYGTIARKMKKSKWEGQKEMGESRLSLWGRGANKGIGKKKN